MIYPGSKRVVVASVIAAFTWSGAHAHGIAGNRFFVGTLTFDDPSVADEAVVPDFSTLNHPVAGGNAVDNRFDWALTRLLTPVLQVQIDSGWIHRNCNSSVRNRGIDAMSKSAEETAPTTNKETARERAMKLLATDPQWQEAPKSGEVSGIGGCRPLAANTSKSMDAR